MTREEARKLLPIIQAYVEGKTIEYYNLATKDWRENYHPNFRIDLMDYRIKPVNNQRPFKSKEECFEEMKKHESLGWIKDDTCIHNISIVDNKGIHVSSWEDKIQKYTFKQALDVFTFMDGEPFGTRDE